MSRELRRFDWRLHFSGVALGAERQIRVGAEGLAGVVRDETGGAQVVEVDVAAALGRPIR